MEYHDRTIADLGISHATKSTTTRRLKMSKRHQGNKSAGCRTGRNLLRAFTRYPTAHFPQRDGGNSYTQALSASTVLRYRVGNIAVRLDEQLTLVRSCLTVEEE